MTDFQKLVDEGGTLTDLEALAFVKKGLFGIINPEASLLATISAAVDGSTKLVADPKLKEQRRSVNASLLNVYNQITKMIEQIEELQKNALHNQGNSSTGVGETGNGTGGSPLLDRPDHGDSLSG